MKQPASFFSVIAACIACTVPAHSATISAKAPIAHVTVFSDRAAVTRTVDATIPAGAHTLRIGGLPSDLDADSLRIKGEAAGELRIGAVQLKTEFADEPVMEQERQLRQELQALEDERQGLLDQIAAFELQLGFIKALSAGTAKRGNEDIAVGKLEPAAWEKAWTTIGSGAAETYAAMRRVQIKERSLNDRIQQKRSELTQIQTGRRSANTAYVSVEADRKVDARLDLAYQVRGASWRPVYEARLNAQTGEMELTLAGEVRQQTGEAWDKVTLTLSTARPARGAGLVPLNPWFIDFARQPRRPTGSPPSAAMREQPAMAQRDAFAEATPALPIQAQIDTTAFSAEYHIPGRVGLPADNSPHRFPVTTKKMKAELVLRAIPKHAPTAYLYAFATHDGPDPLLPGPVSLYRDDMFTGTTTLDLLRPGETVELAFGVDDKIAIDYRLMVDKREESGLVSKTADHHRQYRIDVANHHNRPITLKLLDQVPVAKDERIAVTLTKTSTKPDERDVENRAGVLEWNVDLNAGQNKTIDFGYVVSHPVDLSVPGF